MMEEATEAVREPRYWKITVNPDECPKGAWAVCQSRGLAMLGLPGEQGEAGYAVRNMKRVCEGDWLVAYTPQEGAYTVGGVGRVTRGYQCEEGPFDHPWNGLLRRSLAVEWRAGACSIAELVKDGRFRKGKIPRVLDEITAAEFTAVRDRVFGASTVAPEREQPEPAPPERPVASTPRPSPLVLDPHQEQPPLPQFFLEWAKEENVLGPDIRAGCAVERSPAWSNEAIEPVRANRIGAAEISRTAAEAAAAISRSREAHLLSSFGALDGEPEALDFGLPTIGNVESPDGDRLTHAKPTAAPSEVRVGAVGWTGLFRREVESGRSCFLLLRGPQYSFLNMTPSGTTLRGLPLFALFAIGAVAAPGKEAFRSGATFIFRGRRASGDYEVEVRPCRARPVFREPLEAAN
jgi:hypothetical protein